MDLGDRLCDGGSRCRACCSPLGLLAACPAAAQAQPLPALAGRADPQLGFAVPDQRRARDALREAMLDHAPRVVEFFPEEIDPCAFPGPSSRSS
jgi:hypothetical protein